MTTRTTADSDDNAAHQEAMVWMSRIDRGLSPDEQDEFFQWLAASPANGASLNLCRQRWRRLDRLADWRPEHGVAPNPDLLAPRRRLTWPRVAIPALLAAACIALLATVWRQSTVAREPTSVAATAKVEDRRILPDQSVVKLNEGAAHTVAYTDSERRVRLTQGEAFFIVAKDPTKPFVVEAGGATLRALGTAFNVRLTGGELEVLVAEGRVEVAPPGPTPADRNMNAVPDSTVLRASQRISLSLAGRHDASQVATLTRREIQQTLAWQHGLMTFQDQPLAAIVEELNRLNTRQVVLKDDAIAGLRFSGTIRSDNLDGFMRLLQTSFGAEVANSSGNEIHLRTRTLSR